MANVLIVPGRGNSGPDHWQTHLQASLPGCLRVDQEAWDEPELESWARQVDRVARLAKTPPVAVAHSFGCLALVRAILAHGTPIAASILVAPADPLRFGLAEEALRQGLGHPSEVLASTNDPWLSVDKAHQLAKAWGSEIHVLGAVGHINVESGFGPWPEIREWALAGRVGSEALAGSK